jgi:two-component sensor histidine kinase
MTGVASSSELLDFGPAEQARAVLNILDDFADERASLRDAQRAVLNILDDANAEKENLKSTQRAVLNILDDLALEKGRLETTQQAVARSEQALRASLKEKEVLLKEIHHRVKNNLQVISSLLNLQARYLKDAAAREIFTDSQNRVLSIALVHEKLYQSANLSHVNFSEYVSALLDNLFHTYDASERGIRKVLEAGQIDLAIDVAIPCGLIVNELAINSLKHAFPQRRGGQVRVVLKELGPDKLHLLVADDGVGMPPHIDPRNTPSLGLDLVFTFADQLDAEVEVSRDAGTAFRFEFLKAQH